MTSTGMAGYGVTVWRGVGRVAVRHVVQCGTAQWHLPTRHPPPSIPFLILFRLAEVHGPR